ncbi:MAG: TIGR01777 family oxidoreductase [Salinivirgaceae bacterium]
MKEQTTVLIAGATGFVGKALVTHLLELGYKINVLTRNPDKARLLFPESVGVIKWPDGNSKLLLSNCKRCDAIINLSGANIGTHRWTLKYKKEILRSRTESIIQLEEIAKNLPDMPGVWIQATAVGFYGADTNGFVNEQGPKGNGFLADVVEQTEQQLQGVKLDGIRKVVLRLGIVISPEGGFLAQMKQAFNLGLGVYPGDGLQYISWIHLDDLVGIISESIKNRNYLEVVNAVSPNPISFKDFSRWLIKRTRALVVFPIPAFVFRIFLGAEKTSEMLLANQRVVPEKLKQLNFTFRFNSFSEMEML